MVWKRLCSQLKNFKFYKHNAGSRESWRSFKNVNINDSFARLRWSGIYLLQKILSKNSLFNKFYSNFYRHRLITTSLWRFLPNRQPVYLFAGAVCSFSWEDNSITNDDIWGHINELNKLQELQFNNLSESSGNNNYGVTNLPEHWETIVDEPNLKIWKLPYKNTEYMQYKVFGRFFDVTARQFFAVQSDVEYRKKWDNLALDIDIVDENKSTGEQVLRWLAYFPYPFNAREYIYIRRQEIYKDANVLAILARSVDHPKCAVNKRYVRVPLYVSDMVIKPHTNIDEPGIDYLLTYCDDPQTSIPAALSSWVVSAGIPEYIEKLHKAALNVKNMNSGVESNATATSQNFYNLHFNTQTNRINTA